jgi:hypothetical protein
MFRVPAGSRRTEIAQSWRALTAYRTNAGIVELGESSGRAGGFTTQSWPNKFAVYPDLLLKAGYHVGLKGKGWGPGDFKFGGPGTIPQGRHTRILKLF